MHERRSTDLEYMHLSFLHPAALTLLLLLPVLWLVTLGTWQHLYPTASPRRRALLLPLLLRSIIFIALVLALAGAQLVRQVEDLTVVFLIDASDSVSPAQREYAVEYINEALAERGEHDKAAVVLFGENALVEQAPGDFERLQRLTSAPITIRTSIAEALQLGMALFPADAQKRMVLFSDGEENVDRAAEAARLAAVRAIPLDVVALPDARGSDVQVTTLDAPDTAREGQEVTLQMEITSDRDTSGQVQLFADGNLVETRQIEVDAGTTVLPITVPGGDAGFRRYEVRLEAQQDTQPANNRAATFTTVEGPPRVLLIASEPPHAAPLQQALEAAGASVEIAAPEDVPADQAQLQEYAAVVLVDVLARDVPHPLQEALPLYVREQGGSLAMIGGTSSFGAGGWRRSPIAEALPVQLDPDETRQRPDLGLVLVIDRSGSMAETVGGGRTKLDLAKEAVFQASLGLERNDQIGVVAFDTIASWMLPMQPLPEAAEIEAALSKFIADGGTDIRSGVDLATEGLANTNARVKHAILLTDGIAPNNYGDLIDQMHERGVTISIVSIGVDADPRLATMAERGGGRFYRVRNITEVPDIFLSETILVAGRDIKEELFKPLVALPAPVVRGVGELPPLQGYNVTEPRRAARTILVSPDGKPVLAQWQYGLGRSVAWTSDFKGQWAEAWVTWEHFPRFAGGLLDMLLPPEQSEGVMLETRTDGSDVILELTAQTPEGRPLEDVEIEGRLLTPEDTRLNEPERGRNLTFTQVGAGRYRAVEPADMPGVYLAQVVVLDSEGQSLGTLKGGAVVAYSPEYSSQRTADGSRLLQQLAAITGGAQTPQPAALFRPTGQRVGVTEGIALPLVWLALLLWPLDIALRRLRVRHSDMAALMTSVRQRLRWRPHTRKQQANPDVTIARLQAARSRARRKSERSEEE